jgi:hypothetical protein
VALPQGLTAKEVQLKHLKSGEEVLMENQLLVVTEKGTKAKLHHLKRGRYKKARQMGREVNCYRRSVVLVHKV